MITLVLLCTWSSWRERSTFSLHFFTTRFARRIFLTVFETLCSVLYMCSWHFSHDVWMRPAQDLPMVLVQPQLRHFMTAAPCPIGLFSQSLKIGDTPSGLLSANGFSKLSWNDVSVKFRPSSCNRISILDRGYSKELLSEYQWTLLNSCGYL